MRGPSRWLSVLLALACIVVAAAGTKLSEQSADYFDIPGAVGTPVKINQGELLVTGVRAASAFRYASAFSDDGDVARTPGIFLMVSVQLSAPGVAQSINEATLEGSGRVYDGYSSTSISPDAGFRGRAELIFEVDPRTLTGLKITLSSRAVIHGIVDRAVINLGITDAVADQLRAGAAQTLEVEEYPDYEVIT